MKMTEMTEALIFDMGHVFVDFEWEEVCNGFCRAFSLSQDQFKPILKHIASLGYETGHIDTIGLLAEVEKVTEVQLSEEQFHELWNATFRENDEMSALLSQLKTKYPLYLLSNTNESHWHYLENKFEVSRHFQDLVLSFEVGFAKPQAEIYHHTLSKTGKPAEKCLFIDDLVANVEAARSIGIDSILFQSPEHLQKELKQRGLL